MNKGTVIPAIASILLCIMVTACDFNDDETGTPAGADGDVEGETGAGGGAGENDSYHPGGDGGSGMVADADVVGGGGGDLDSDFDGAPPGGDDDRDADADETVGTDGEDDPDAADPADADGSGGADEDETAGADEDGATGADKDGAAGADEDMEEEAEYISVPVKNLIAVENPANALSFYVQWQTDIPAGTVLELDCGEEYRHSYRDEGPRTEHSVFVMGLWDGAHCTLTARGRVYKSGDGSQTVEIDAGPLPDFLPELTLAAHKADKIQAGWTLFNLSDQAHQLPLMLVMVDHLGRYRWYHQRTITKSGGDTDLGVVPGGVLVGGGHNYYPAIVDWEGALVWEGLFHMHHHIQFYGEEGHLLYLVGEGGCPGDLAPYRAGVVSEYDMETEEVVWKWRICDHYIPPDIRKDWAHLNTVEAFPGEDALLVSSREQHALFKVDRENGDIVWKLGLLGDFELSEGDQFHRPHSPEILPGGNILLFDNGQSHIREYSRAVEIAYDVDKWEAQVVWLYRPDPDIFAPIYGDADRQPNGNTVITFGRNDDPSHIMEITTEGEKVWELVSPLSIYRSERIIDPVVGYVLRAEEEFDE